MNYTEIVATALAFADRTDSETVNNVPNFLKMVEAKINRVIRAQQMEVTAFIAIPADVGGFDLPIDFAEAREVLQYDVVAGTSVPLQFLTPHAFSAVKAAFDKNGIIPQIPYFSIISNNVAIFPVPSVDYAVFLVYYSKIVPLTVVADNNWVSEQYPDIYISGLVFEISSFVKNPDAAMAWNSRFDAALGELTSQNWLRKWPGASLVMTIQN